MAGNHLVNASLVQEPVLPEKSVKYVNLVTKPIVNPTISKITPDHVKGVPGTWHIITKSKPQLIRQEMRQEKPAYDDPSNRLPFKPIESPKEIYQRERDTLVFDSLEHDIGIDCEENYPHQEGVISKIYQRPDKPY